MDKNSWGVGDQQEVHACARMHGRMVDSKCFCPRHADKDRGYVKCPCLSTRGGEGVKIGQNLVHVVVECPLNNNLA